MQRRIFLLSALLAGFTQRLLAAFQLTPPQGEGPFYPVEPISLNNDLVHHAGGTAVGERLELSGIVRDTSGKPVADVLVEIWQCDAAGRYRHPRAGSGQVDKHFAGSGAVKTSGTGNYRFSTLMPVPYTGRPPHIHVKIHGGNRAYLTSQIYLKGKAKEGGVFGLFSGDRGNLTIDPVAGNGGLKHAEFDFVIERNG